MDELTSLAKRLADYVRMTIETGELKPDSPIGIAYRDFIAEWGKRHPDDTGCICKPYYLNQGTHNSRCPLYK